MYPACTQTAHIPFGITGINTFGHALTLGSMDAKQLNPNSIGRQSESRS